MPTSTGPHLVHCVYFRLKDRTEANVTALVDACKQYLNVQAGILYFAAGRLAKDLNRAVNVQDWDVALTIVFVDSAHHDAYQDDPTHQRFIDENRETWDSVRVFDSLVDPA
ncbi:Dabb family protein [Tuwongella immobilis]|uniref:Stress-response A/B barrel domain-containing protein n=1 Tax=Tuwongella immobilis TaxID=692036 RepID=A0A6C2YQI6_9BACT|nr:Dabb family protein [Tuwongella immobilis]VIP03617.1 Stress responsive alpha-beta barrel domain-containing protein OS=Isosphaera pallida (strain ATCC 43644 / DSM 9630 / IS1B) GN=Isop_2768 PE=4 SV=1: Dabb [Tuwongella immobilis]VTS04602.1 Stress responsive alpha-beta barrel domain-containing protein OS=Isosphaera pallida (strain ATCC 43644 / DSM 9630 / IS1B) GN=Isop_2768 PE=4 SV=1: Dabb [Tuwongella immobilis]